MCTGNLILPNGIDAIEITKESFVYIRFMADVHNSATRSFNMSRIKAKDTKPELSVRKFLFANGFRYKLHAKYLPGKPDIVLTKYKTVLFINGCFWHGHEDCRYFSLPKTRTEWWLKKISANKNRDIINSKKIKEAGWHVINIFECNLKSEKAELTLRSLVQEILTIYNQKSA